MAEETNRQQDDGTQQGTQQEPQAEPHGEGGDHKEVDWEAKYREAVAQGRKWESRAKENKEKADKWDAYEEKGMSEQERLTKRAESAEAELAELKGRAQHDADAAEVSKQTGVPQHLLAFCADREAMESFAKEYASEGKVPAAAPAPSSRVQRNGTARLSTAEQFAEMAEQYFRH